MEHSKKELQQLEAKLDLVHAKLDNIRQNVANRLQRVQVCAQTFGLELLELAKFKQSNPKILSRVAPRLSDSLRDGTLAPGFALYGLYHVELRRRLEVYNKKKPDLFGSLLQCIASLACPNLYVLLATKLENKLRAGFVAEVSRFDPYQVLCNKAFEELGLTDSENDLYCASEHEFSRALKDHVEKPDALEKWKEAVRYFEKAVSAAESVYNFHKDAAFKAHYGLDVIRHSCWECGKYNIKIQVRPWGDQNTSSKFAQLTHGLLSSSIFRYFFPALQWLSGCVVLLPNL